METEASFINSTAENELRRLVLDKIIHILQASNDVRDSQIRLAIQASCLDVTTDLEDFLSQNSLDKQDMLCAA